MGALYGRGGTSGSSSAFEHVFVGEIKQRGVVKKRFLTSTIGFKLCETGFSIPNPMPVFTDACPICLKEFQTRQVVSRVCSGPHYMHSDCYLNRSHRDGRLVVLACPICRRKINEKEVVQLGVLDNEELVQVERWSIPSAPPSPPRPHQLIPHIPPPQPPPPPPPQPPVPSSPFRLGLGNLRRSMSNPSL
ncbi:hypothetical protein M0R45_018990 [Rubus argutus]|uniref:RING-type domain-containing protein n=1 Tax=Rubus argutus TaxID=59490 RepID=A0AAW1X6S2_RUBAR